MPATDIYEAEDALTVILEMPGVEKSNVSIHVEDGALNVEGRLDLAKYRGLQPPYTNTTLATIRGASAFRARLIRARSQRK